MISNVIPAQAGIQFVEFLDSRLRGNDILEYFRISVTNNFYRRQ